MCGACGAHRPDWTAAALGTSHARSVVARALSSLDARVAVRTTPVGWTVDRAGRGPAVLTRGTDLLDVVASAVSGPPDPLDRRTQSPGDSWAEQLDRVADHRPVDLDPGRFPDSRVIAPAPRQDFVAPERVIIEILRTGLRQRLADADSAHRVAPGVVVGPRDAAWMLLTTPEVSPARS